MTLRLIEWVLIWSIFALAMLALFSDPIAVIHA